MKTKTLVDKEDLLESFIEDGSALRVLDKGYVRLVHAFGSDLDIVNAARASFAKESTEMTPGDEKLIAYLCREGHFSPMRHAFVTIEFKAPLEIARQIFKYVTGSAHTDSFSNSWNEQSKRYTTSGLEFYVPAKDQWRSAPANRKQGSAEPVNHELGQELTDRLLSLIDESVEQYEHALANNVAPEVARLFLLGYGMYINWRWSTSIQGLSFFLNQRLDEGAQSEIQEYAQCVKKLTFHHFPYALGGLLNGE